MPVWISHRGIPQNCSENSLRAFTIAVDAGFTWLETDLRCTADGEIVISHDSSLKRIFGQDVRIETSNLRELSPFRDPFQDGILEFSRFAERFPDCGWVLDMKQDSAEKVIELFASSRFRELINGRLADRTKFLFWNRDTQRKFEKLFPGADCFAREAECWRAGLAALAGLPILGGIISGKTYALPPSFYGIDLYIPRIFAAFHSKNSKILAYLPVTPDQARRSVDFGADYVLANSDLFNKSTSF